MINIGIICPSEIALRRFLPSIKKCKEFNFVGVAIASPEEWYEDKLTNINEEDILQQQKNELAKAELFVNSAGGKIFKSYLSLVTSSEIDAIYIPLPPALHYKWGKIALLNGKHVLMEKPFSTTLHETQELINLAEEHNLAIHENYMFTFHNQIKFIDNIIQKGEIGKVRLYNISFGFPKRAYNDFRYNKKLGGGALLDCGGYTIKYASILLGESAKILTASSYYENDYDVDIFGSGTLINDEGIVAQISFGMDNNYKCALEAWGSKGSLYTGRILTAPDNFCPEIIINKGNEKEKRTVPTDETFVKSILHFNKCICNNIIKKENYYLILKQAQYIDQFKKVSL